MPSLDSVVLNEADPWWDGTATVTLHFRVQSKLGAVVVGDRNPAPDMPTTSHD